MAIRSTTSQVVFMYVALVPPKVIESSFVGTDCTWVSHFDGGALILVPRDDWPCHDQLPDPGAL
eukprot:8229331-Prorocentrum_lima.AAC.1